MPKFEHIRECDWCEFRGTYPEFPDGSLASNGWMACGKCLSDPRIERAMELVHFAKVLERELDGKAEIY